MGLPEFGPSVLHSIKRDHTHAWVAQSVEARSREEVCEVLRRLPERCRLLAFVAALTGLTWGELGALEWRDTSILNRANSTCTAPCPRTPLKSASRSHERGGERGGYLNHRWFIKVYWRPTARQEATVRECSDGPR